MYVKFDLKASLNKFKWHQNVKTLEGCHTYAGYCSCSKEASNWSTGLEGYKVYRCDRKERIGGVVAIWVKDSIAPR